MLNNQMGDFGAGPGKGTIAILMLGLGLGLGWGLYRTFSPAEQKRRLRIADARDHARKLVEACRRQVAKAREDVVRVTRGEYVTLAPLEPCVIEGKKRSKAAWDADDEIEDALKGEKLLREKGFIPNTDTVLGVSRKTLKQHRKQFIIRSLTETDEDGPLYWSNVDGWVDRRSADKFPVESLPRTRLVGRWEPEFLT